MTAKKIEFADGRKVDILAIYGQPMLIRSAMRDTLQLEFDPNTITFESLMALFSNTSNLETLTSIDIGKDGTETRDVIGEGYTILSSISMQREQVNQCPGSWNQAETHDVYVVTISQETYAEYELRRIRTASSGLKEETNG